MPLTKLQFKPGINREITSYSNEGGWRDCDKVRFRFGFPEKMGGWQKYTGAAYLGSARALHNWIALDGSDYLGIGTHLKYYIEEGTAVSDITPVRNTTALGEVTFAAVTSSPFSNIVTVTDPDHGAQQNDFVTFSGAESLGGAVTAAILNAEHQITRIVDADTYEITVSVTSTASDTGNGGNGVGTVTVSGTAVGASGVDTVTVGTSGTGVGLLFFTVPSSTGVGNFTLSGVSAGTATHTGIVQTSTSGSGTSAEFTVVTDGAGGYSVSVTTVGSGYAVGDTILIEGQNIGGAQGTNDLTLTITALAGSSVGSTTHTGVTQTSTSGSGTGAQFSITTDGDGGYSAVITTVGSGYAVSDTITIAGTSIGGATPANDLVLTVTQLSGSSIGQATYTGVTQTSTSGSGTGAEFTVVTDGLGGYTAVATAIGSGYTVSDTITIAGTSVGGSTPANDLVLTITALVSVAYTNVPQDSTSGSGTGATFTVVRDGSGNYTVSSVGAIGSGYAISDTITIDGDNLGGTTPANDLTLTVATLSHPTIANYQLNVGLDSGVGGTGWGSGLWGGTTTTALQTTLNEGGTLTPIDTDITVTSASGISASDVILIDSELILVGAVSTNTLTGCTRGHSGTTAASHTDGTTVYLAVGNSDPASDFTGWGDAAAGGVSVTSQIRLWSHDNFGEDLLINPRDAGIYYWDKTTTLNARAVNLNTRSGTKTSVPTSCKQVLVSDRDRHVIAFGADDVNTSATAVDGNGLQDPLLIRFSNQEDALQWFPTATNTAGTLRLGAGSTFVQAVETKREILIWTDTALTSMRFIGPPFTFGLQQLSSNITIMSPNAALSTEDFVFWMGIDTFYIYDGRTQTLPCTVKDKVFLDFNLEQRDKVVCGVNSEFSEVIWFYPSANATENDRYVTYNYLEKVWYFGTIERTAWLDRGTRTFPVAASSGYIYNHEFGYDDDGATMDSFIESSPIDIGDGDKFTYIKRLIPDITFEGSGSTSSPQATFTLKARNYPGASFDNTDSGAVARTQSTPVEKYTNELDLRVRGRSFAIRVESDALGSKWKLGSPRVDAREDGRR